MNWYELWDMWVKTWVALKYLQIYFTVSGVIYFIIRMNFVVVVFKRFTLKSPSPLFISTSPPLLPLLHNPPFVLLLLSFALMLFCPVQSRLLCGPSVSHPLNAIFIQTALLAHTFSHNDKNFVHFFQCC